MDASEGLGQDTKYFQETQEHLGRTVDHVSIKYPKGSHLLRHSTAGFFYKYVAGNAVNQKSPKSNIMHIVFVLPCNCLSSRQLSRVKNYISSVIALKPRAIRSKSIHYTETMYGEWTKKYQPFLANLGVDELITFSISIRISLDSPVSKRCRTCNIHNHF